MLDEIFHITSYIQKSNLGFLDDILINQNKANFEEFFLVISSSINFLILKSEYLIFFLVLFYLKKYT